MEWERFLILDGSEDEKEEREMVTKEQQLEINYLVHLSVHVQAGKKCQQKP